MSGPSILLVSNGIGEAEIARTVAAAIAAQARGAMLEHFPLVGALPADAWPKPVGPQTALPSGGLVAGWNVRNLWRDLRAGLAKLSARQYHFLSKQRQRDVLVAVGDVYCLAVCLLFARRPTVFVATAKSEYVAGHSALECAIARRAVVTFARDEATAEALRRRGVQARCAGNAMMDAVSDAAPANALAVDPRATRIAVLPGSRADAPRNAAAAVRRLRRAAGLLHAQSEGKIQAFVSVAPSVNGDALVGAVAAAGITLAEAHGAAGVRARGVEDYFEVTVVRGHFAELVVASDMVIGQAGTANEQAAGLGRPVVAAAAAGERPGRMGWYRMRQQRLLGGALLVLPADDEAFASGLVALIRDPARRLSMARIGRERMGAAGASLAIAAAVLDAAVARS